MKLLIEINDEEYVKSFLSILSVGVIESIKEKKMTIRQSENLLFYPNMIFKTKEFLPEISEIIHEGTEMENIDRTFPEKIDKYINDIKKQSLDQIKFKNFGKKISYEFDDNDDETLDQ